MASQTRSISVVTNEIMECLRGLVALMMREEMEKLMNEMRNATAEANWDTIFLRLIGGDIVPCRVDISEDQAISFYMVGLPTDNELVVRMFKPQILATAYSLSKLQVATNEAVKRKYKAPLLHTPKFNNYPLNGTTINSPKSLALPAPNANWRNKVVTPQAALVRNILSQKEMEEKRAKNLCFYCDQRINQGEVRVALQKMGRNKAIGPDQIPIEAWRSTTEAINLLRNLIKKYRERQRDLHMAFLDLEMSYDSVPQDEFHDDNPPPPPPPVTPTQQASHTLSTIKLPILKKGEYDIWAMKMEHYLGHTDYPIWEVIQKGNGSVQVSTDTNGQIRVLPPKTAEEILAREKERKERTTLLMSIPEDHLAKFHKMTDAKEMWEAIKSRFGGNDESKNMQKNILKQLFERFSVSPLKMPIRSFLGLYLLPGPK
ncbi:hypothetical protein Tco_0666479 [Tanacetum coccineum]